MKLEQRPRKDATADIQFVSREINGGVPRFNVLLRFVLFWL